MSATKINVRSAVLADLSFIAGANIAMAFETEDRQLNADIVSQGVWNILNDPANGFYMIAEVDGQTAGSLLVTFEYSDWRAGVFWWLQSVYVLPAFRGQGVFRSLYRHMQGMAQADTSVCGLRLYADLDNATAKAVYLRLGMQATNYLVFEEVKN